MQPNEQPSVEENSVSTPQESPNTNDTQTAPAMSSASGNATAAAPPVKRGPTKRVKLLAAVTGLAILLIGGSAAAYYSLVLPSQPQRIVQDSLRNTLDTNKTKSAKFEGELTCEKGDTCKTLSSVTFEGGLNDQNQLQATVVAHTAVTKVNFDVRSVGDKSIYLRLSGLDGLDKVLSSLSGTSNTEDSALIGQFAPLLAQVNNQWYNVDESLLKQLNTSVGVTGDTRVSSDDAKKIGDIYKQHQFIQVDKKLADEKIHGVDSYHIQATIKKDELKAFMADLKNANIKNFAIEQKDIDEVDKADFSKYPFELWVRKSDRKLTQVAATIADKDQTMKLRVAIYDINQPVTVEKPAGSKSVMELLGGIAPLLTGSTNAENQ